MKQRKRRLGRVEQAVRDYLLKSDGWQSAMALVADVFPLARGPGPILDPPTAAEIASIKRAIASLQRKGVKVERETGVSYGRHGARALGATKRRHAVWRIETAAKQRKRERARQREEEDAERILGRTRRRARRRASAPRKAISAADRANIAKILGMLGSAHEGERQAAADMAEKERARLGLSWAELLSAVERVARPK